MIHKIKIQSEWYNVFLLSSLQTLFQICSFIGSTLSVLVGMKLAPNESLATLPVSVVSLGTASMMIPAAHILKRIGEKKGFMGGTLFGIIAGVISFYGIIHNSFTFFIIGTMMVGCYQGFAQFYRFAAADSVTDGNKAKAISFVMAAGVLAAIAGPNLAKYTQNIGDTVFAYSYLSITVLSFFALVASSFLRSNIDNNSPKNPLAQTAGRPIKVIATQKNTIIALTASAIGYSVMTMVMTATPIAMHHCGHSTGESATVIQWHLLGMFVPSFFTGTLIKKFGVHKIITVGITILFVHIILALTGTDFMHFISGLILLGIGWNFMYIGGSTLLTSVYNPEEKQKAQAFHDFMVFAVMSTSSFSAGILLKYWNWEGVNMAAVPLLIIALVLVRKGVLRNIG